MPESAHQRTVLRRFRPALGRVAPSWLLPQPVWPVLVWVARLTTAAVVAYLLTVWLVEGPTDLTGALTALLVVQASASASLRMGAVRVGAVLTGVLVAVTLSSWVGLTWWSLGAAIALALLLASVLRLGDQRLEAPISAMLILGMGGQEIAAETRVLTTFIGAGVGMAFNLLLPPRVPIRAAVADVRNVSSSQAGCLRTAASSMAQRPITKAAVTTWLDQARAVAQLSDRTAVAISTVTDLRRFNPRAIGTPEVEPVLRAGLASLDHSLLAIRTLFATMLTEAPEHETPDDGYGEVVRPAFAVLLGHVADCLDAFGALVEAEAENSEVEVKRNLAEGLDVAGEARAVLTELLLVDPREETTLWLLRGSILTAVDHVLVPLKLEDRARLHEQQQSSKPRATNSGNVLIRDMLASHQADRFRSLVARPTHASRMARFVLRRPARRRPRHRRK
ncbi:FUSC family protein [Ornithinimicrobium pratense]|uniref:FUSC family protein n=1 Tax=Ornithinimicrobium pratense TaxID=2593973 RepID=A0A5J6V612_9MICO|nr:aromatic acid exporter family protein [Ornithinimicrobium pratense]QFG68472.1 FUSC family protein [Ornithinimicrobium pratense]